MKNFLNYQSTEYDCGPTTVTNAIRYLFEREEIPPTLIKGIMMYGNDTFNDSGEMGKRGTSPEAIHYLACWLNGFSKGCGFPLRAEALGGDEAKMVPGSRTLQCVEEGGAALIWCWSGGYGHYVLLTSVEEDGIGLFDPYYEDDLKLTMEENGARIVNDQPCRMNRVVKMEVINADDTRDFAMGEWEKRVNLLMWNTSRQQG